MIRHVSQYAEYSPLPEWGLIVEMDPLRDGDITHLDFEGRRLILYYVFNNSLIIVNLGSLLRQIIR
jgi:hypothetical protein